MTAWLMVTRNGSDDVFRGGDAALKDAARAKLSVFAPLNNEWRDLAFEVRAECVEGPVIPVTGPSVLLAMDRAIAGLYCPSGCVVCEPRFLSPVKAAFVERLGMHVINDCAAMVFSCSGSRSGDPEFSEQFEQVFPEYHPGETYAELAGHASRFDAAMGAEYARVVASFDPQVLKGAAHFTSAPPGSAAYSTPTTSLVGQNNASIVVPSGTTLGTLIMSMGGHDPCVSRVELIYNPSWASSDSCRAAVSLCVPACLDGTYANVTPMSCGQCVDVSSSLLSAAHAGHHYVATAPPSSGAFNGVPDIQKVAQGDRKVNYGVPSSIAQSLFYGAWVTQATPAYATLPRATGTNGGVLNPTNSTPWWPLALTATSSGASTATTGNFAYANLPVTSVYDLSATGLATVGNTMFNPALPASWSTTAVTVCDTSLMAAGSVNDVGIDRYTISAALGAVRVGVNLSLQWTTNAVSFNNGANSCASTAYLVLTFATATAAGTVTERTLQLPLTVSLSTGNIINTTTTSATMNYSGVFTGYISGRIQRAQITHVFSGGSIFQMSAQPVFSGGIRLETLNPWGAQANVLLTNVVGPATVTQTFTLVGRAAVNPDRIASMQSHITVPEWTSEISVINAQYVRAVCKGLKVTFYRPWGNGSGELDEMLNNYPSYLLEDGRHVPTMYQYHRMLSHAYAGGFWDSLFNWGKKAVRFAAPLLSQVPGPIGAVAKVVGQLVGTEGEAAGRPRPRRNRRGLGAFPDYPTPSSGGGRASGLVRLRSEAQAETYAHFMQRMVSYPLRPNDGETLELTYIDVGIDGDVRALLTPDDRTRAPIYSDLCAGEWPPEGRYRYHHAPLGSGGPDSMVPAGFRARASGNYGREVISRRGSCPFPVVIENDDGDIRGAALCTLTSNPEYEGRSYSVAGTGVAVNHRDPEIHYAVKIAVRELRSCGYEPESFLVIECDSVPLNEISGSSLGAAAILALAGFTSTVPWTGCITSDDGDALIFTADMLRAKAKVCPEGLNVLTEPLQVSFVKSVSRVLTPVTPDDFWEAVHTALSRIPMSPDHATAAGCGERAMPPSASQVLRAVAAGRPKGPRAVRAAGVPVEDILALKAQMHAAQNAVRIARLERRPADELRGLSQKARELGQAYAAALGSADQEARDFVFQHKVEATSVLGRPDVMRALGTLTQAKKAVERVLVSLAGGNPPAARVAAKKEKRKKAPAKPKAGVRADGQVSAALKTRPARPVKR
jgi:hypothetical protein